MGEPKERNDDAENIGSPVGGNIFTATAGATLHASILFGGDPGRLGAVDSRIGAALR